MMRRYTLNINSTEFVVDVQEAGADKFDVVVGGETYAVTLSGDQAAVAAAPAAAAPVAAPAPAAAAPAAAAPAARKPAAAAGKGGIKAPMPGVILEVSVKAGDKVKRGQKVAILDAMKMQNVIGAPKDGTIGDICVAAGQSVGHGEVLVTFVEG
ncbi:MAG: biotin/lipoyl-containing protein [Betaproteobacteria bacterium]